MLPLDIESDYQGKPLISKPVQKHSDIHTWN